MHDSVAARLPATVDTRAVTAVLGSVGGGLWAGLLSVPTRLG
jgi:hypothetical protein